MKLLFELSKEYEALPRAEVLSCLKAENIGYEIIDSNDDVLVIETNAKNDKIKRLAERLSLTFFIDELLFFCKSSIKKIRENSTKNAIKTKGSIAIKYKNRSNSIDSQPIVKTLAEIYSKNRIVNLDYPDVEIRVLITDPTIYVGLTLAEINRSQFEERKVQYRPFFSPISLHPKIARALVNLSLVKKDEILLDPFCGTGGILLEGGLIGAKIIGSDIEEKMIEGCKKTLNFYNITKYKLFCSDVGDIKRNAKKADAVVTDLPYGKSTTTKGENINQLHLRAFESISKILKKNGVAVIGLSNKDIISIGSRHFSLLDVHELRVHKSLTRYFAVYKK